jgi:hypothetical protein
MRNFVRLSIAAALAVSLGFVWTVGQSGLQQTNRNLCELWSSLPLPAYKSCEFQNVLVNAWLGLAVLGAVWITVELWTAREKVQKHIALWSPQQMIVSGLIIVVIGVIVIGIGIWRMPNAAGAPSVSPSNQHVLNPSLPQSKFLTDDGGPIKWVSAFPLMAALVDHDIKILGFQAVGQNESDEFISPLGGFVRSGVTGQQFPLLLQDERGGFVAPDGYGLPAKHQFQIRAPFSDSISTSDFTRLFGRMTFELHYGTHVYIKHFTPDEFEQIIRQAEDFLRPKPQISVVGVRPITPNKK